MKLRYKIWPLIVLLGLSLLLASCSGGAEEENEAEGTAADEESAGITLGFISHLTGNAQSYGESIRKGSEVALAEINAAGGINGQELKLIVEDDQLDSALAQAAAQRLIDRKVPVILGSASSSLSLAIAPLINEAEIVQLTSVSTAPELADYEYAFMLMPSDATQGAAWADLARSWQIDEAAVLFVDNDYGHSVKEQFEQEFAADGGTLLAEESFELEADDFQPQLAQVKKSGAGHVFLVAHMKEGVLLLQQAKEMGLNVTWITDAAMQSQEVVELLGDDAQGLYAIQWGRTDHPAYADFEQAFQEMHGHEVTIWADFAYDTVKLAAAAIAAVGTDPADLAQWLQQVENVKGASGPITIGEDGFRVAAEAYQLYVVHDGAWTAVTDD